MKSIISFICAISLVLFQPQPPNIPLLSPSAVLIEAGTGTVIYEKDADTKRSPASITKIMTLLLIFDELAAKKISLSDEVTTSAYAKSMGGSQVFLEEGEKQTVETLIKCIVVASGNDASVAMAEYISGSEAEFVKRMNERAKELGMHNTNFEDCCGLTTSASHVSTARDVALMARELITKYPEIKNYSTIWMENITHNTKQGSKEFGLSNTNKLLKMAVNFKVTGLKTGSTSLAKYCVCATAENNGIELIATVMAAPDYKVRFADAASLLGYGYSVCSLYKDTDMPACNPVPVSDGTADFIDTCYDGVFSYLSLSGEDLSKIERKISIDKDLRAPLSTGDKIGELIYSLNGNNIGSVAIVAAEDIKKAGYGDYIKKLWIAYIL